MHAGESTAPGMADIATGSPLVTTGSAVPSRRNGSPAGTTAAGPNRNALATATASSLLQLPTGSPDPVSADFFPPPPGGVVERSWMLQVGSSSRLPSPSSPAATGWRGRSAGTRGAGGAVTAAGRPLPGARRCRDSPGRRVRAGAGRVGGADAGRHGARGGDHGHLRGARRGAGLTWPGVMRALHQAEPVGACLPDTGYPP